MPLVKFVRTLLRLFLWPDIFSLFLCFGGAESRPIKINLGHKTAEKKPLATRIRVALPLRNQSIA